MSAKMSPVTTEVQSNCFAQLFTTSPARLHFFANPPFAIK